MVEKVRRLALLGMGARRIAKELNICKTTAAKYLTKLGIKQDGGILDKDIIANRFEERYPQFQYISGYMNADSGLMVIRCKKCDTEFEYTTQVMRPSRNTNIQCKKCNIDKKELKKNKEIQAHEALKVERKQARQRVREKGEQRRAARLENHICEVCGKRFKASRMGIRFDSDECKNKYINRRKQLRKRKFKENGRVDKDITLEALIIKHKGKCGICGMSVDAGDCWHDKRGNFITGKQFPTIDHILPRVRGGTHTWDNVQLAHKICNSRKSACSVYGEAGQLRLSL